MGKAADNIRKSAEEMPDKHYIPVDTDKIVSTGSTLLDLAISGGRIRGGGVPGGIIIEISGPSSSGKTALMAEIGASVQEHGGDVKILDPEARLDQEYARLYGLNLPKENYARPDTVNGMFEEIDKWNPKDDSVINMLAADSIAALTTELELSDKGDKMGMRKAKDLTTGLRKSARKIAQSHKLIVFTNQERDGDYGKVTSGGKGVPYHASIRIRVARVKRLSKEKILKNLEINEQEESKSSKKKVSKTREVLKSKKSKDVKVSKVIGIESECSIIKSSVDDEFRKAPIYIIFGFGIDDIRANLQWYKDMTGSTKYLAVDKEYSVMDAAIKWIEENDLEEQLREMVIDLWEKIENKFKIKRKKKRRF